MIQLYKEDNKNFHLGGDITLDPFECNFNAKLNGAWDLHLVHPVDTKNRYKYIKEGAVIRFPTPTRKDDLFRIYEVIKTHDSIEAYAEPLPKDLRKKVIQDINIVGKDGQGSIERILEGTGFTGYSNIIDVTNIRIVRKSVYSALFGDEDNTFISRLGGEVFTNKFDIYINDHIGTDSKNLYATFGVNLQELEEVTNMENVYTRLWPIIFNGHTFNCVDSDRIDNDNILEGFVKFDDIKLEEDATEEEKNNKEFYTEENAKLEVIKRCKKLFEDGLDLPSKTYTLSIANLDNLDLYKKYKFVTKIDLGDLIIVRDKVLDAEVRARCIEFTWDCLREEYTQLVLGTEEQNIFNDVSDASNYLKDILTSNNTISGSAIEGIINAVNVQLKAQYNIAEHQHVRAMLFEDLDEESPTFGALCIGTQGLEISNKRNAQNTDWEWGTFITAGVVSADFIRAGILTAIKIVSSDNLSYWDLSTGELVLKGSNGNVLFKVSSSNNSLTLNGNMYQYTSNGLKSMDISNNKINFYNWGKDGDFVGCIGSVNTISDSYPDGDPDKCNIGLWNDTDSSISIDYKRPDNIINGTYMIFDKYNIQDNHSHPIKVNEGIEFAKEIYCWNPINMHNYPIYLNSDGTAWLTATIVDSTYNSAKVPHLWSDGKIWSSSHEVTGADYSECFEWEDENKDNEDRIGYLVSLKGDKIIKANGDDILGIISSTPSIVGDNANEWQGKYKKDKWGRYELDEEGNKIINKDYDPSIKYITRSERPEWGIVGLVGKIICRDDGTTESGDYITSINGIATKSNIKTKIRMMNRIDDETIRVFII